MAVSKKPFLVPYSANGSIQAYPESTYSHHVSVNGNRYDRNDVYGMTMEERVALGLKPVFNKPDMRPNDPWTGTLRLDDFYRGRSASRFIWYADGDPVDNRRTYPMFMVDMLYLLKADGVSRGGLVHGRWDVAKRGANFGIRLIAGEQEL